MKKIVTLLLISLALFANSLQKVPHSFSDSEQEILLEELSSSSSSLHTPKTYDLKKGWNQLSTPLDGVDVVKTFADTSIVEFVVAYDKVSEAWAMYSPEKSHEPNKILFLKYLEPNVTFFVLAKSDTALDIKSNFLNESCKKIKEDDNYSFIIDSGIEKTFSVNKEESVAIQSRYYSHHEQGVYNDTRTMLIYPKLSSSTKDSYKYGPAKPKVALRFSKEYEGKKFYIYNYREQKCYIGIFPSIKVPPFPVLKEI